MDSSNERYGGNPMRTFDDELAWAESVLNPTVDDPILTELKAIRGLLEVIAGNRTPVTIEVISQLDGKEIGRSAMEAIYAPMRGALHPSGRKKESME